MGLLLLKSPILMLHPPIISAVKCHNHNQENQITKQWKTQKHSSEISCCHPWHHHHTWKLPTKSSQLCKEWYTRWLSSCQNSILPILFCKKWKPLKSGDASLSHCLTQLVPHCGRADMDTFYRLGFCILAVLAMCSSAPAPQEEKVAF